MQLLRAIAGIVSEQGELKEKQVYIGVKGRIAFGAIQVPPARVETGSILRDSLLYDFYGGRERTRPTIPTPVRRLSPVTPPGLRPPITHRLGPARAKDCPVD